MSEEKPYIPPKRVLVIDRPESLVLRLVEIAHFPELEVTSADTFERAVNILNAHQEKPFDWVIVRKNIGIGTTRYDQRKIDAGFEMVKRIQHGEFGDYSSSRLALVTNSVLQARNAAKGEHHKKESVERLYKNSATISGLDYVFPHECDHYIADIMQNGNKREWSLPKTDSATPEYLVEGASFESQMLDISPSNISR